MVLRIIDLVKEVGAILETDYHVTGRSIVSAILKTMKLALLRGEDVSIPNLGRFKIVTLKKKTKRVYYFDWESWAIIDCPEKKVIKFYPSRAIEKELNKT